MILSKYDIKARVEIGDLVIDPFVPTKQVAYGMSYGLSHSGYDVRIDQDLTLYPVSLINLILHTAGLKRPSFSLASTIERFKIPKDVGVFVVDKSSWIRKGLTVHNSYMEPGWAGYLTLELKNVGDRTLRIKRGMPIAQLILTKLTTPTEGYRGKYQNQSRGPQESIHET